MKPGEVMNVDDGDHDMHEHHFRLEDMAPQGFIEDLPPGEVAFIYEDSVVMVPNGQKRAYRPLLRIEQPVQDDSTLATDELSWVATMRTEAGEWLLDIRDHRTMLRTLGKRGNEVELMGETVKPAAYAIRDAQGNTIKKGRRDAWDELDVLLDEVDSVKKATERQADVEKLRSLVPKMGGAGLELIASLVPHPAVGAAVRLARLSIEASRLLTRVGVK